MMNMIFPALIITSVVFGFIGGNIEEVGTSAITGARDAVNLGLTLLANLCFWGGFLKVCEESGLSRVFMKAARPIICAIFPRLDPDSKAASYISMNMAANFLGLGNAATPLGISAIKELDKINRGRDRASDEMCMMVVINTASIQLIPTTLFTLRIAAGSSAPFEILLPVWAASICAFVFGVTLTKALSMSPILPQPRRKRRRLKGGEI